MGLVGSIGSDWENLARPKAVLNRFPIMTALTVINGGQVGSKDHFLGLTKWANWELSGNLSKVERERFRNLNQNLCYAR